MTTIIVTIIPIMLLVPTVSPPIFLLAYTRLSYSLPHSRELRFSSVGNGGLQAREARRKEAILMTMAQRVPELEAPASPEAREGDVTSSEEADKGQAPPEQQEPTQRRSWLRAFFGLPQ